LERRFQVGATFLIAGLAPLKGGCGGVWRPGWADRLTFQRPRPPLDRRVIRAFCDPPAA